MKSKKNQNAFIYGCKRVSGDVGVKWCTLKVMVPIKQLWLGVDVFDCLVSSLFIQWDTYSSCKSFTHNTHTLATLDTIVQV